MRTEILASIHFSAGNYSLNIPNVVVYHDTGYEDVVRLKFYICHSVFDLAGVFNLAPSES